MASRITQWFGSLPIRRKLVAITAASTSAALLLAGGGFLAWDVLAFRTLIDRDVTSQSRVLVANIAPAVVFNDERAAGETIAALGLRPLVVMGCVYGAGGRLFATYHRERSGTCPPMSELQASFGWERARFVTPVTYAGSRMGTLYIDRELADVQDRMFVGIAIVAGLIVLCMLVALAVGVLLQRSIVEPMLQLAATARAVSDEKSAARLVPTSEDEMGVVMHAFNDMLDRITERTTALSRANADLQREIDERTRVEAERMRLLARERDSNRLKDEFLATLSHELRTPLNAVLGWTRVLRATPMTAEAQARALESIERNARTQARLVEDLLEVSRIVSGKLRLNVRPADLAAILDAAADVIQPAAAAKRIAVRVEVDSRPAMTSGDPDRLQQVIWNLLSNAVKFTPVGGHVHVTLRRQHGYVLTVRDSGVGIDAGFLPHIFEPFRQADGSASREHGGLGLGLAIVKQIVELHGGTVRAESAGRRAGATFEVQFPSELPGPKLPARRDPAPAAAVSTLDGRFLEGVRVLVVDDEEDALELMRTTFASYGAAVDAAASAREAMQIFERTVPDVLVSDIGMPLEDGYALISLVRRLSPAQGGLVPAVALTAYASPSDRLAALAAGYQAHVSKPYEPSEVAALVERLARGATTTH
jgi:signal transduction histidine kinase/CheY-like chemotaxis protein